MTGPIYWVITLTVAVLPNGFLIILSLIDSGHDVRPVRGNHDDMMLRCFTGQHDKGSPYWEKQWGFYTVISFGFSSVDQVPVKHLTLLDSIQFKQKDDDYVFVHAGLDTSLDDPITQTSEQS